MSGHAVAHVHQALDSALGVIHAGIMNFPGRDELESCLASFCLDVGLQPDECQNQAHKENQKCQCANDKQANLGVVPTYAPLLQPRRTELKYASVAFVSHHVSAELTVVKPDNSHSLVAVNTLNQNIRGQWRYSAMDRLYGAVDFSKPSGEELGVFRHPVFNGRDGEDRRLSGRAGEFQRERAGAGAVLGRLAVLGADPPRPKAPMPKPAGRRKSNHPKSGDRAMRVRRRRDESAAFRLDLDSGHDRRVPERFPHPDAHGSPGGEPMACAHPEYLISPDELAAKPDI